MKRITTSLSTLVLMMSSYAFAATYTYTGSNYTGAGGEYTTDMRVTGIIVTSSPIPPGVFNYDIRPILVSWSFNDGAQTIDSSNGEFSIVGRPRAETDRRGNVTHIWATVVTSPPATAVGESENIIWTEGHGDLGAIGFICEYDNFGQGCSSCSGGPNFSGERFLSRVFCTTI